MEKIIIKVFKRGGNFIAEIKDKSNPEGYGESREEAIGDLILADRERFGIEIVDGKDQNA